MCLDQLILGNNWSVTGLNTGFGALVSTSNTYFYLEIMEMEF